MHIYMYIIKLYLMLLLRTLLHIRIREKLEFKQEVVQHPISMWKYFADDII